MQGFAKIQRGINICGIATCPTFPANITDPWKEKNRLYTLHLHDVNTTGARCLDGSPSGVYYSKGYGDGANKTIIFFEGGGWCTGFTPDEVKEDCYGRSETRLGSTDPNVTDFYDNPSDFMLSINPGDSKYDINYYNWNRFWFVYCDGTGHQGYIEEP
jgi:O-palmitoleoyl-L-serine hydrolase